MYYNPDIRGTNDDLGQNQFFILGSPDLDPFTSDQIDAGVEWYFADDSLLSFTLFHKDVKNFVTFSDQTGIPTASLPSPGFGGVLRDNELLWTVQTKSSNTSASINGFEVQYQHAWDNGFGLIANYTYTDAEADNSDTYTDGNLELSDSSKNSYNLTGYYENEKLSARLSYSSRSEYMIREAGSYGNRLHDDYASLDFSAAYHLTDNIDIKFDIVNITGEDSGQEGNNAVVTNHSGFQNGFPTYQYRLPTRYILGASFKF
jgi:iron complex outermembrane receptor protein